MEIVYASVNDDVALGRTCEFFVAHGRANSTPDGIRAWLALASASTLVTAYRSGETVGVAIGVRYARTSKAITVQLAADPGDIEALSEMTAACEQWKAAAGAQRVLTLVTDTDPLSDALGHLGFVRVSAKIQLRRTLSLADANAPPAVPEGYRVTSLREEPHFASAVLDVWNQSITDIPSPSPELTFDLAQMQADVGMSEDDPWPAGFLVLLDDNEQVVGFTALIEQTPDVHDNELYYRMTGVARDARGRGVARALKAASIAWAAHNGFTALRATNDDANTAMLATNRHAGFIEHRRTTVLARALTR